MHSYAGRKARVELAGSTTLDQHNVVHPTAHQDQTNSTDFLEPTSHCIGTGDMHMSRLMMCLVLHNQWGRLRAQSTR